MITNMNEMLRKAKEGRYAVGAFNFNEFSDLKGIVAGAVESNAPVILMSSVSAVSFNGVREVAYAFRSLCEEISIPCVLHLDHAREFEIVKKCIEQGFTSVMIDASTKPIDENIEITKRVVDLADKYNVSVEAELGTVAGKEDDIVGDEGECVNPETVADFISKTGIDALAVGIGTVHGFYKKAPKLRFDLIEEVASLTGVPLVMHGGSGLSVDDFKKSIHCGISKVNVGTELKHAFASQLCKAAEKFKSDSMDPRDFLKPVREVCKAITVEKMAIFDCIGKA
jgi:ketose-bisphosphate aldolase